MRRRIFNLMAAASLGLLVAGLVMALLPWPIRMGGLGDRSGVWVMIAFPNGITVEWLTPRPIVLGPVSPYPNVGPKWLADAQNWNLWTVQHEPQYELDFAGVRYRRSAYMHLESGRYCIDSVYRQVSVEYWLWWAAMSVLPVLWIRSALVRIRGERRMRRGLCVRCGYDMRGTPVRCPECGEEVSATLPAPWERQSTTAATLIQGMAARL